MDYLSFQELIDAVLSGLGTDQTAVTTDQLAEIKRRINAVQNYIFYYRDWEWRRQRFYLTTTPPYETGSVALTQGSKSIVGTSSSWLTDYHKLGLLRVNDLKYQLESVSSTTTARLRAFYPKATVSG